MTQENKVKKYALNCIELNPDCKIITAVYEGMNFYDLDLPENKIQDIAFACIQESGLYCN